MRLSVVIPALNEAGSIRGVIGRALSAPGAEAIVADGGSIDGTPDIAEKAGARVISAPRGRALQMNAGAAAATGGTLLFLHADTILPEGYEVHIEKTLSRPGVAAGAFHLRIDSPKPSLRIIERLTEFRANALQMPYGDQGIFLRQSAFDEVGGFPDMPIMEDYELMSRLRRLGRIAIADAEVVTSARRWEKLGVLRTTVINQIVIIGYNLGVRPERLKALYKREYLSSPRV